MTSRSDSNRHTVTDLSFLLPIIAQELASNQTMISTMFTDFGDLGPVKFVPSRMPEIGLHALWRATACDMKANNVVIASQAHNDQNGTETLTLSIEDQPDHRIEERRAIIRNSRGEILCFGPATTTHSGFPTKNILYTPYCAKKMQTASEYIAMEHKVYRDVIKLSTGRPIVESE